jgi:hypothetical protein
MRRERVQVEVPSPQLGATHPWVSTHSGEGAIAAQGERGEVLGEEDVGQLRVAVCGPRDIGGGRRGRERRRERSWAIPLSAIR